MIRIERGSEPARLATERNLRLRAAMAAWIAGDSKELTKAIRAGFGFARVALFEQQSYKCAYCERNQGMQGNPVEHFRPKGGVKQENGAAGDPDRYWWLTWTWHNLLFACSSCNTGFKNTQFPVAEASDRLPLPPRTIDSIPAGSLDLDAEQRLLVDPAQDDPLDHIRWQPRDSSLPEENWEWHPVGQTPRGKCTIRVLGLDHASNGLFDAVTNYLHYHVLCDVRLYRADPTADQWSAMCRRYLTPHSQFVAAAWCALDHWVPPSQRAGLTLPRPKTPATEAEVTPNAANRQSPPGAP